MTTGPAPLGYELQATLGYVHTGNATSYTGNALGQVLTAENSTVKYTYTYDVAHRLASVTDSRGGKRLNYTWSPGGRLLSMQGPDDHATNYLYDPVGRLTGIWPSTTDVISFVYDAGGRLAEKWFPNGVTATYAWNPDNTLASLVNRHGSTLISQHGYTYDAVGNRVTHTERIGSTETPYQYTYDALERLTEVRNAMTGATESYAYDPLGNRRSKTAGGATTAYVYDAANQLLELRDVSSAGPLVGGMVYDANGNMIKKCEGAGVTRNVTDCTGGAVTTLSYDSLQRISEATLSAGPSERYAYDADGRRVRKTIGDGGVTEYVYSGVDIVAEYAAWTAPMAAYTHGAAADDALIRTTSLGSQYYHSDGLASIVALSGATGTVDATARYTAWGASLTAFGTIPLYGYTGREPDGTALLHYRARYYDPAVGRFTQRDPIGLAGGLNSYAYAAGNPVTRTDPFGLDPSDPEGRASNQRTAANGSHVPGMTSGQQSLAATQTPDDVGGGRRNVLGGIHDFPADGGLRLPDLQLVNPTGGQIRPIDDLASEGGGYRARRQNDDGSYGAHGGLDFVSVPGQAVVAPFAGKVQAFTSGKYSGVVLTNGAMTATLLYVGANFQGVRTVGAGDTIGVAHNIRTPPMYGPRMTNHMHLSLVLLGVGNVDPTRLFFPRP